MPNRSSGALAGAPTLGDEAVAGAEKAGESLHPACPGLSACRLELDRLRDLFASLEREHRRVCEDYAALEEQVAELGNRSIVMERVHGTLDHREVLEAIQDCVINVIGSEELAVFELSGDGRALEPVQTFGVDGRRLAPVAVGTGPIGRAAAGEGWVIGDGPAPLEYPDLTACVPLEAGEQIVGALAIWRMLGHKPVFGPVDRGVLELLARQAGVALHLTSPLRAPQEAQARPRNAP
jgi:hypothetical protein